MSRRQTVFFLPIDPRDKDHKDPEYIDFSVPRRARYVHSAWKKHQDAVFWVDIGLAFRKGLTFYQTRSNAIILQGTLPASCIPKVERLCKGNVSCTSYSRTFGYGRSTLRTMARTPQSTLSCTMRSSEHAAHRLLMHSVHTSHSWLKVSPCVSFHIIHACALVSCLLSGLSSPVSLLLPPVPLPALPDVHPGA